jgi:hypothetical protein
MTGSTVSQLARSRKLPLSLNIIPFIRTIGAKVLGQPIKCLMCCSRKLVAHGVFGKYAQQQSESCGHAWCTNESYSHQALTLTLRTYSYCIIILLVLSLCDGVRE